MTKLVSEGGGGSLIDRSDRNLSTDDKRHREKNGKVGLVLETMK